MPITSSDITALEGYNPSDNIYLTVVRSDKGEEQLKPVKLGICGRFWRYLGFGNSSNEAIIRYFAKSVISYTSSQDKKVKFSIVKKPKDDINTEAIALKLVLFAAELASPSLKSKPPTVAQQVRLALEQLSVDKAEPLSPQEQENILDSEIHFVVDELKNQALVKCTNDQERTYVYSQFRDIREMVTEKIQKHDASIEGSPDKRVALYEFQAKFGQHIRDIERPALAGDTANYHANIAADKAEGGKKSALYRIASLNIEAALKIIK